MSQNLIAALLIGFSSSAHCVFMCGGIAASIGTQRTSSSQKFWLINSSFHLGRLTSYALIGVLVGFLVSYIDSVLNIGFWLRILAGVLLILMGLYIANVWRGLAYLEKLMQPVWRPISVFLKQYLPARGPRDALIVGVCWGWLPCGLIYSTLVWATTATNNAFGSGLLMFTMGIGSLPVLFGISLFSGFLKKRWTAIVSGMALCLFGVWTIIAMPAMSPHEPHAEHSENGIHAHE